MFIKERTGEVSSHSVINLTSCFSKKFPVEELLELFPEGSGNLRAENFVPAWFLLENHHATSFEDLKLGLNFLGRKVGYQSEGKLSFLKVSTHLDLQHYTLLS